MNYDKSGWILPALIFILWRCVPIKELMINEQIRYRELRVIGQDGEQLGIMSRDRCV